MRTVVIEDEINNLNLLSHFIKKYCPEIELVGSCQNKKDGVTLIDSLKPDLVFLDIVLEEHNAFELLEEINNKNIKIIFITAFDEFALKAFRYHAADYLLKPIQIDELIDAVKNISDQIKNENNPYEDELKQLSKSFKNRTQKYVIISNLDKVSFVRNEDIIYCKSSGRYTEFFLTENRKLLASKSLGEYEQVLNPHCFFRIHKSYVVNLDQVLSINKKTGNYCELKGGATLPISRRRMESFFKYINSM